jgi:hypothetical protein
MYLIYKVKKMKKLLLLILLLTPALASAEYMDVIKFKLTGECSFTEYLEIKNDFNSQWGKANGYSTRVAMALQNDDLESMYWIGTAENAAAFGAAWDTWRDALGDANSVPAKLSARFQVCSENISRHGYDIY